MVGGPGTGKTDFVKGNPEVNVPGLIPLYLKKGMSVIVYNNIDHPKYRDVKTISINDLPRLKKGVFRIIGDDFSTDVEQLRLHAYNALIVFEDSYKYVPDRFPKPLISLILDPKQKNIDVIFMYHSWGWVARDMGRRVDGWLVCQTADLPGAKFNKKEMPYLDDLEKICITVNKSKNRFQKKMYLTNINQ
jgi:hypothetical protein